MLNDTKNILYTQLMSWIHIHRGYILPHFKRSTTLSSGLWRSLYTCIVLQCVKCIHMFWDHAILYDISFIRYFVISLVNNQYRIKHVDFLEDAGKQFVLSGISFYQISLYWVSTVLRCHWEKKKSFTRFICHWYTYTVDIAYYIIVGIKARKVLVSLCNVWNVFQEFHRKTG